MLYSAYLESEKSTGKEGKNIDTELRDILMNMQNSILGLGIKLDRLEERMDRLEGRMDQLEGHIDQLDEQMGCMREQINHLDERITSLESVVKETRIVLEQETNRKITALYDGREDELRYRELIIIHDKEIRRIKPRLNNMEVSYRNHLAKYHTS